jgi:hypothetical protein
MEIKIIIKDGDKSARFQFAGDPLDIIKGISGQFSKVAGDWTDKVDEFLSDLTDKS